MKEQYIAFMEWSLQAYSVEYIKNFFNDVKASKPVDHGFARLTANIGILISHGLRQDLLPLFREMMEHYCKAVLPTICGNEFSVREIVACIWELEANHIVSDEELQRWKAYLSNVQPTVIYNHFATKPTDTVRNWALFAAVSEFFRQKAGLCDSTDFYELQVEQQLQFMDENGMYRDNASSVFHQPIIYDIVPRGLFSILLDEGYRGKNYATIDNYLKKAGLLSLRMQSPNGEAPFGGRSNQFLHNEAWLCAIFEFEAKRYAKEGNFALATEFRAAAARALSSVEEWLSREPISHVKNRYAIESFYGCEHYARFDKYMITVASFLYAAYQICDDSIPFEATPDHAPQTAATTEYFHKFFMKSGGYGLEFDLNADQVYDSNGLGRIHKEGAPSPICLSSPCPGTPRFPVELESPVAFSLCSALPTATGWHFGAEDQTKYELLKSGTDSTQAWATLQCQFPDGKTVLENYVVSKDGVSITAESAGQIGFGLPAFSFDGEISPEIIAEKDSLTVSYRGWRCRYTTNGTVVDLKQTAANRNGHYLMFVAVGQNQVDVHIKIEKI